MKYEKKLKALEIRRQDPIFLQKSYAADKVSKILQESYKSSSYPDSVKYTLGSLAEVDKIYTENTFKEGDRIINHLNDIKKEGFNFSYRYQGSTTNNTHIKAHSDIDILIIQENFIFNEISTGDSYAGNWKEEQQNLRESCFQKIRTEFYSAQVDNNGEYSISVSGGSLQRKVDIVPSCWNLDKKYYDTRIDSYKGIRVYKKNMSDFNKNYPFLNNLLIEKKDIYCNKNYTAAIRLLKTLKSDSLKKIDLSSYDIVSILYHLNNQYFTVGSKYLLLVKNIKDYFLDLISNPKIFHELKVPDETRKISDKVTIETLKALTVEIGDLESDLISDLSKLRKTLNEEVSIGSRTYPI